jgi:high-affinity Fe2+/Pb2+ permease
MRKLEEWWFHYYSTAMFYAGIDLWVRYVTWGILALPAIAGIVLDQLGMPIGAGLCFILFMALMIVFSALWIIVWIYHNWRIKHER